MMRKIYKTNQSPDTVMLNDMLALPVMAGQDIQIYISKWTLPKLALMLGVRTRTVFNYVNMDVLPRAIQFSLEQADLTNGNIRTQSITGLALARKMQLLNWTSAELAQVLGKSRDSIDAYLRGATKDIPLNVAIAIDYLIITKEFLIKYKN